MPATQRRAGSLNVVWDLDGRRWSAEGGGWHADEGIEGAIGRGGGPLMARWSVSPRKSKAASCRKRTPGSLGSPAYRRRSPCPVPKEALSEREAFQGRFGVFDYAHTPAVRPRCGGGSCPGCSWPTHWSARVVRGKAVGEGLTVELLSMLPTSRRPCPPSPGT